MAGATQGLATLRPVEIMGMLVEQSGSFIPRLVIDAVRPGVWADDTGCAMIDPSLNEIFQLLGCDDEDVFDAPLKSVGPATEARTRRA